ncbi:MAG TPA: YfiR family protein, partial [Tepidisphaeraceae bacterium]|nr:YfiR family protein [Tepidisphaeraceae bacterium]
LTADTNNHRTRNHGRVWPMGRRISLVLILMTLVWMIQQTARANSPPSEYEVEAAFILNFAEFITWPAHSFHDGNSPLIVGVIGNDPFGKVLDNTFAGIKIDGHPVTIRRARDVDDLRGCQMIYISPSEKDRLEEILANIDSAPVVTISELNGFCWRGGIVNFYIDDHKVRFEINIGAARRHGLKVSSQLLSRARIVGNESARADK